MINFNSFLLEMSIQDAMETLGVDSGYTDAQLKKAFRRAANKNHPDKGGSTEKMKLVNQANDLLKNHSGHVTIDKEREVRKRAWYDIAVRVHND